MAIRFKKIDFSTITVPTGKFVVGYDITDGILKQKDDTQTLSVIGGGGGIERVDVQSVSFQTGSSQNIFAHIFKENLYTTKTSNLLFEVVDATGIKQETDSLVSNYLTDFDFFSYLITQYNSGAFYTVKFYFYKNQSREKIKIAGRNLMWWRQRGIRNYGYAAKSREKAMQVFIPDASPEYLNVENAIINGYDLINPTWFFNSNILLLLNNRQNYYGKIYPGFSWPTPNPAWYARAQQVFDATNGAVINTSLLTAAGNFIFEPGSELKVRTQRNGGMVETTANYFRDASTESEGYHSYCTVAKINFQATIIATSQVINAYFYVMKPLFQDTFLLSKTTIPAGEKAVLLVESANKNPEIIDFSSFIHVYPDETATFGVDISDQTSDTATQINRLGNIYLEDIKSNLSGMHKGNNKTKADGEIRVRVGYGKEGIYTFSDDVIYLTSGFNNFKMRNLVGFVNKKINTTR